MGISALIALTLCEKAMYDCAVIVRFGRGSLYLSGKTNFQKK